MEKNELFNVLGIEPTKNESEIKTAYRERLAVTNPEDNPVGFKRLRQAYEEACAYARTPDGEPEEVKPDDTPSGLWVQKAGKIYSSLSSRRSADAWRTLFEEDIFQSLDGEEECRRKLLIFIMDNFKLPTEVWKLLDDKLGIVAGERELAEHFPRDFVNYIVNRCTNGEEVEFDQFEGADDADYDAFLRCYDACWRALRDENYEYAEQMLEEGDRLGIRHPVAEINRANLFLHTDRKDEAVSCMEKLLGRHPGDDMIEYNAAEIYWGLDKKELAAPLYESLRKRSERHYMANLRLTSWYYDQKRYAEAKKCAENVISYGFNEEFGELLKKVNAEIEKDYLERIEREHNYEDVLELCWCCLQDEKFTRGLQYALSIGERVQPDRQAEYLGLLAKLYRESAMYEEAVDYAAQWEEALQKRLPGQEGEEREKDIDRIRQSHMIRMTAYHSMAYADNAYFQKALDEILLMSEKDQEDPGVLLEKARIYMEMEEYDKCLETVTVLVEEKQVQAAHATALEAYRKQWNAGGVVRECRECINSFPQFARAYEQMAKVFLDLERNEELESVLKEAEENGVKSVILDAYKYQSAHKEPEDFPFREKLDEFDKKYKKPMVRGGDLKLYEEGLPILTEYLYMRPGNYMLVERGLYHMAAGKLEEAKADFQKVLEECPYEQFALNNLGCVYKYSGQYDKAIVCFRKAIRYMDEEPNRPPYGNLGDTFDKLGEYELASQAYEALADRFGRDNDSNMEDILEDYSRCGKVEKAVALAEEYYEKRVIERCSTLCDIYEANEEWEKEAEVLREWHGRMKECDRGKVKDEQACWTNYLRQLAWYELLTGQIGKASRTMEAMFRKWDNENSDITLGGAYEEMILCSAMMNNERKCKKYAKMLRKLREKEKELDQGHYFYRKPAYLFGSFLEALYLDGEEAAEKILGEAGECLMCRTCDLPVCMEMKVAEWLLRKLQGRAEESAAILKELSDKIPFSTIVKMIALYDGNVGKA